MDRQDLPRPTFSTLFKVCDLQNSQMSEQNFRNWAFHVFWYSKPTMWCKTGQRANLAEMLVVGWKTAVDIHGATPGRRQQDSQGVPHPPQGHDRLPEVYCWQRWAAAEWWGWWRLLGWLGGWSLIIKRTKWRWGIFQNDWFLRSPAWGYYPKWYRLGSSYQ